MSDKLEEIKQTHLHGSRIPEKCHQCWLISEIESLRKQFAEAVVKATMDAAQLVKDVLNEKMVGNVNPERVALTEAIERIEVRAQEIAKALK